MIVYKFNGDYWIYERVENFKHRQIKEQTMDFKYGDKVEVWDFDDQKPRPAVFVAYDNDNSHGFKFVARDNTQAHGWKHCRHARPDLKVDDKVWVGGHNSIPRHFAGWDDDRHILCWALGNTSHTTRVTERWEKYSLTDPKGV